MRKTPVGLPFLTDHGNMRYGFSSVVMLPSSLQVRSVSWFMAVFLSFVAMLSGIVATFLPMKTILILASGSVPGFFPQFLVTRGVAITSLVMILCAGVAGVISWAATKVCEKLDQNGASSAFAGATPDSDAHQYSSAMVYRKTVSLFAFSAVVSLVVGLVSLTFFLLSLAWVISSFFTILLRARRSVDSVGGSVEKTGHQFVLWIEKSSVWSSVGIALLTLVVSPPSLGTTGILIAAIFGRRLLTTVSEVIKLQLVGAVRMPAPSQVQQTGKVPLAPRPGQTRAIDHFVTEVGRNQLEKIAVSLGFSHDDWRVVGNPGATVLSIAFGVSGDSQTLVRIFPPRFRALRNMELRRRLRDEAIGPFDGGTPSELTVHGFPALRVNISANDAACSTGNPTRAEAIKFEVDREFAMADQLEPKLKIRDTMESLGGELREGLENFLRLPGSHQEATKALLELLPQALRLAAEGPATLVPDRLLRETDFYKTKSGEIRYLGGHSWTMGRLGQHWYPVDGYERVLIETLADSDVNGGRVVALTRLNGALGALRGSIKSFKFGELDRVKSQLDQSIEELQGASAGFGRYER